MKNLVLKPLGLDLCVLQYPPDHKVDGEFLNGSNFLNIVRTDEELSVVCEAGKTPKQAPQKMQEGWKAFKVQGPLDFSLTGILSAIAAELAENKISIFAISTFDTDYVLVRRDDFAKAQQVLGEKFTLE